MSLLSLIKKNLLLLVRARGSALVVILGPLFLVMLAGLAFDNTNVYNVRLGTYSPSETQLIKDFQKSLSEAKFKLQPYADEQGCINAVKTGEAQACVAFSAAFDAANPNNAIAFYVDYSRINLVSTIIETLSQHVSVKTAELSKNLAASLLNALDATKKAVDEKKQAAVNLATQNDAMLKIVAQLEQELGTVDVNVNVESFGTAGISESAREIQFQWTNFSSYANDALTTIILGMSKLKSDINTSNLSEADKSNLTDQASAVLKNATALRASLSSRTINDNVILLNASIQRMASAVSQANDKLQSAQAVMQGAKTQVAGLKQQLDASLVQILDIQKAFSSIEQAIAVISVSDAGTVAQPVKTTVKPIAARKTYLNYLFPSLLVVVLLFTGILLAPLLLLLEKHSAAGFRNYMTPVPQWVFSLSIFLSTGLVLCIQVLLIVVIAIGMFSLSIGSIWTIVLLFLVLISLFTLLGMVIGELFQTEESSTLAAVIAGSILLFLSDILIPIETMPESIAAVAAYNPVVLGSGLLRKLLLFEGTLTKEFWILLGFVVVLAAVVGLLESKQKFWFKAKAKKA